MSYDRIACLVDGKPLEYVIRGSDNRVSFNQPGADFKDQFGLNQNTATYTFGGTFKEETMQNHKYLFNVSIWDPREEQFTVLNYPVLVNHSNDQEKAKAQAALDKLDKGSRLDDYDFIVQYFGAVRTKASFEDKK